MINFELTIETEEYIQALKETEEADGQIFLYILESVGWDTVAHLRSHTSVMRPPVGAQQKQGASGVYTYVPPLGRAEGPRPAHPGGWADISSNLANAYRFEIWAGGNRVRWTQEVAPVAEGNFGSIVPMVIQGAIPAKPKPPYQLVFLNDMEYAAALEALDGYFVLSGVTEPGGPVDRALRAAIDAVPDFEITDF